MQDADHGAGQEAIGPIVEPQGAAQEEDLRERSWMEGERDLGGHGRRLGSAAGTWHTSASGARARDGRVCECPPVGLGERELDAQEVQARDQ